ncbi:MULTISPECIES: NAD(P)/FAD-dependent oxidoreductase [unclassified Streptomyces]|uniref:FAD-dependent oxidoreductase n=1 Tax=unclassified Streptomyces TaxID=2593676 RepID=UPI0001C1A83E|nr:MULTISPECIES: NAD(P)/FAD-dependent oxidoreductase [unclassified Streptomyces]AEN10653.1 FAD dependent oxidoreductase [Streptomyces sp. SirexAA-E]MYR65604.1 NAD(P)-binding protein [Streptomyces sp. SID4939]MYS00247.1 NAD(P)-binding protein [Streptomyces sp. SID4940]MYT62159.1 NAD(P)-binding protein [Streptomyces sp. SID8357]MYT84045.1 NAD(P)-binding protein [Streptomyces sp. SID8360]
MNSPEPANARISIIGAGPGGLTCARVLQRRGIAVTVYDRDPGPDARNQGGTLDLHADNGQVALREAGLLDAFFALARPEGQEMRQMDAAGTITSHQIPAPDELFKPEIDRGQLRDLLLESVQPGTVHWGRALDTISGPADGPRRLHFADGTTVETDLVIGADGAFSRVRPAVSPAVPEYTGVSFLEAWFSDVENRHPAIAELVGPGSAHAADGERGLFAQRNGGNHIRVYLVQRVPVDWISADGLTTEDTDGIRAVLRDRYAHWSPRMLQMITENDGPYVDRPILALPVPHTWDHDATVTLLGDAAHLMPPLGVGVNLAMLDACELALALANAPTVDDAVRAYESTMLPRSTETAEALEHGAEHLLSTGIPDFDDDAQPVDSAH